MLKKLIDTFSAQAKPGVEPFEVPLFPLGGVLFPGGLLPLKIFEQRYLDMAKSCLKNGAPFGVCLIKEGAEVGLPAVPERVGTLASISEWDMPQLGVLQVKAAGGARFAIVNQRTLNNGLIIGTVAAIDADSQEACSELADCRAFLEKVLLKIGSGHFDGPPRLDDASWVSFRIAELLPVGQAVKQKMLELTDARMRLEILHRVLRDQRLLA